MARILVVDDHAVNRDYIVSLLSYLGHEVTGATDGADALAQIVQQRPDLVITDLLMPGIDGEQLAARLREDPATRGLPVIFLTAAYHAREAEAIARRVGVRHVLAKPADPRGVVALVQQVLGTPDAGMPAQAPPQAPAGAALGRLQMFGALDERLAALLDEPQHRPELSGVLQEARSLVLRLNALARVGVDLATLRQPQALGETFALAVQDLLGAHRVGVVIQSRDDTRVRQWFSRGLSPGAAAALAVPLAQCPAAQRLFDAGPAVPLFASSAQAAGLPAGHPPAGTVVSCAIPAHRALCGWVYAADRLGGEPFSTDDGLLLAALAAQFGLAWEALSLYQALDQRVAERTRALEAANSQMESFAHALAHDLRQPLLSIGGFAGLAAREAGAADGAMARHLQRVQANAGEMGRLIDRLLGFSQLARQATERREVDLNHAVADALMPFQAEIGQRAVTVQVAGLPTVQAHPQLLNELLRQLLDNAVKFTREVPAARIEIGAEPCGEGRWVCHVRDNGIGFDAVKAQSLGSLADPAGRLLANERGTTGMGLATAHRIVSVHGGRLWAEASPGQGATLYFTL